MSKLVSMVNKEKVFLYDSNQAEVQYLSGKTYACQLFNTELGNAFLILSCTNLHEFYTEITREKTS